MAEKKGAKSPVSEQQDFFLNRQCDQIGRRERCDHEGRRETYESARKARESKEERRIGIPEASTRAIFEVLFTCPPWSMSVEGHPEEFLRCEGHHWCQIG